MAKQKTMTVNHLHKLLEKLIEQGEGRTRVCVSKTSFQHPLEPDGCTILDLHGIDILCINVMDGDGFGETNADGREKLQRTAILFGNRYGDADE